MLSYPKYCRPYRVAVNRERLYVGDRLARRNEGQNRYRNSKNDQNNADHVDNFHGAELPRIAKI
jgi:hypothetical protein